MTMTTVQMDELLDRAARQNYAFLQILDIKDYRALMLHSQGRITAIGYTWNLVGKSLGASLYEVTLKRKDR